MQEDERKIPNRTMQVDRRRFQTERMQQNIRRFHTERMQEDIRRFQTERKAATGRTQIPGDVQALAPVGAAVALPLYFHHTDDVLQVGYDMSDVYLATRSIYLCIYIYLCI